MTNKRYHLYAVGNALVDIEVEVTEDQLAELGIEKGVMSLVDLDRQNELLRGLEGMHHKRTGGGSAANTITAAANLGAKCYYSCRVADDGDGSFFADELQAAGVVSNVQEERGKGMTGTCLVMVTPDADRTMNTSLGISADITPAQLEPDAIAAAEWLYVEGYLVSSPNALETAREAKRIARDSGTKVAFTFSDPAMVRYCHDGLAEVLDGGVDVLFANIDEALGFTGRETVHEAIAHLDGSAETIVVTRGAEGALVQHGGHIHEIAPYAVKAVDSNGAGDLFAGSFMYAITHGRDVQEAGSLASLAASKLVTRYGARLDAETLRACRDQVLR